MVMARRREASFNGRCNLCGKRGHKKNDCQEDEENVNKRSKGYKVNGLQDSKIERSETTAVNIEMLLSNVNCCQLCNGNDDAAKSEASKRKETLSRDECTEFLQTNMLFPNGIKLISNENIWIADTGASAHSTPYWHDKHD